jgi:putative transposase
MSETILFIHSAWSTKHCINQIPDEIRKEVSSHIIENARNRSIEIIKIKILADHIHTLIKVHPTQNISQLIHNIKGESSNWINTSILISLPFAWQEGYTAVTVSPTEKKFVIEYLSGQELMHQKMTFPEEIRLLKMDKLPFVLKPEIKLK